MKVIILSSSDIQGGAARCSFRLHKGILKSGNESCYFVQNKLSVDEDIVTSKKKFDKIRADVRAQVDALPIRLLGYNLNGYFSTGLLNRFDASYTNNSLPDIINLHWVANGFLPIEGLKKFDRPIVWTLHDSWAFTGGCHLPGDCLGFTKNCGNCPVLGSNYQYDLSRYIWKRKLKAWGNLNLSIVTDSTWLAGCVKESSLFGNCRVESINPGLDLSKFKPVEKKLARELLSLPLDKKLVLYGAIHSTSDPNKGFQFLQPAIKILANSILGSSTELLIFGASEPKIKQDNGIRENYLGLMHDDISLSLLYSAADVMVVPSIRESFGQTASEALACGTPVVAFGATGLLDIVDHLKNGYLAKPYSVENLAEGIEWVLSRNSEETRLLSKNAREKAENAFSIELMTSRYLDLYRSLI
jgi:glycosyltransferase involved in cell wall biosynthesis